METIEPDKLLAKPAAVRLGRGLALSILIHLALIGLTSIGLYRAWAKWGVYSEKGLHTPSVIKRLEKEAAKAAAEQAATKEEAPAAAQESPGQAGAAAEPAQHAAAAPDRKAAKKPEPDRKAAKKPEPDRKAAKKSAPDRKAADAAPQQTPLDSQVEKPPKNFDLNDIDL